MERTLRIVLGGEIWVELHKIVTKDKPSGNRLHLTEYVFQAETQNNIRGFSVTSAMDDIFPNM